MKIKKNPRIIIAGSVNSSKKTLEKLIQHKMNVIAVLGLDPDSAKNVSGYQNLKPISIDADLEFRYFKRINDDSVISFIKEKQPDILFVVGLSQLVREDLLQVPSYGSIGYHPTKLPEGRGRGAMAWLILGKAPAAATFFLMDKGMDSGDIWVQQEYRIEDDDYVQDAITKVINAIGLALDKVLPELKTGHLNVIPQDHSKATYLGKRNPEDGHIDWSHSALEIYNLIRAVSSPLPGAYTYLGTKKLIILKARIFKDNNYLGIPGRILISSQSNNILVQTGNGLIELLDFEGCNKEDLKVGKKLGLDIEKELMKLINGN